MKIMAAVDFSNASGKVLQTVRTYAEALRADVFLIHVEPPPEPPLVVYSPVPQVESAQAESLIRSSDKQAWLQRDAAVLEAAGLKATPLLLQGPVGETIVSEAERLGVDLIITGSHGHGALFQMLVGSVSEEILRSSNVPVLVIPARFAEA